MCSNLLLLRSLSRGFKIIKIDLLCCFADFRKDFNTVLKKNLWKRLEWIMIPLKLRVVMTRLYKNIIFKFRTTGGWSKEVNYNNKFKQGCPLSTTHFDIYINKLEECLENVGCVGPMLTSIVTTFLLYVENIVLFTRNHYNLVKKLRIL